MGQPTPNDPLGLRPTSFEDALLRTIDERVALAWRARTVQSFDNTPDAVLAMELLSRGWVVYKPKSAEELRGELG